MSPEFIMTALIVCLVPGIGVTYTQSMSLGGGLHRQLAPALAGQTARLMVERA